MKVSQLIKKLQSLDGDKEICFESVAIICEISEVKPSPSQDGSPFLYLIKN